MASELPKQYEPSTIEPRIYDRWLATKAFAALPDERLQRYVIMMPLPNVTGALHMGHAMDNVMQDLLIRWHRMMGDNTLWMPGTDHAGIATQAVIEKRLLELEGKTRHDVGREGLVQRIWEWKEQYQKRIISQQQAMGCSCDWDRQRFTMDDICARAVRWTFFRMFQDGLIFRGSRLVNWDCQLQTAVSYDEIVYETVQGDTIDFELLPGDQFLLCSDGLHDLVDERDMAAAIVGQPPIEACGKLIALARDRGGYDNITAAVLCARPAAQVGTVPVRETRHG